MFKHAQKSRQMKSYDSNAQLLPTQNAKKDRLPANQSNSQLLRKTKLKPANFAAKTRLVPVNHNQVLTRKMSIGEGIGQSNEPQAATGLPATPLQQILGSKYEKSSKTSSIAPKSNASMNYSSEKKTTLIANCADIESSFKKALALDAPEL